MAADGQGICLCYSVHTRVDDPKGQAFNLDSGISMSEGFLVSANLRSCAKENPQAPRAKMHRMPKRESILTSTCLWMMELICKCGGWIGEPVRSLGLYWANSFSFSLGFLGSAAISRLLFRRLSYSLTPPHRPGLWCQVFDRGYTLAEVMSGRLLCQRCVTIETGNVTLRTAGNPSKCPVTCTKLEFVTARGYGNAKKLCNL
ncbi:unnamed protein product [Leuciscus chuanchicus]